MISPPQLCTILNAWTNRTGVSLVRVMSIVGHSELKTTNEYLRKAGVDVVGATDALKFVAPEQKAAKVFKITARKG